MILEYKKQGDYKGYLKQKLVALKQEQKYRFTNEKFAHSLGIESAYLSRCINHPNHHPSRELLYRITEILESDPLQRELLLTRFDLTQATSSAYQKHLLAKIKLMETTKKLSSIHELSSEIVRTNENLEALRKCLGSLVGFFGNKGQESSKERLT